MRESILYLCRHGDTAWSAERRLAGRSDIPLIAEGELNAQKLGARLRSMHFDRVLVSPLARARRTAELAGFASAEVDPRLLEMDFGQYEGRTVHEIRSERPGWTYLRDGCPGGESPADIGRRIDDLLASLCSLRGSVALFAHSVTLRVLAARYLGLAPGAGRMFMMSPGALSVLRYDPVDDAPGIAAWNDRSHIEARDHVRGA
jgi:probable phosphoglycerate mutase